MQVDLLPLFAPDMQMTRFMFFMMSARVSGWYISEIGILRFGVKMTLERIPQKNNSMLKAGGRPNKGKASPKISIVMTEEMLCTGHTIRIKKRYLAR